MAKKGNLLGTVGVWAFLIGLVLSVVLGLFGYTATTLLLVLGLIVGLLNVTEKEIVPFLVATIALVVVGSVSVGLPQWLMDMLANVVIFVVPGSLVAAVKAIYALAAN